MSGPTQKTRSLVLTRDHHRCQCCGRSVADCRVPYSLQHRRARGMGGTSRPETNLPANLITVCGTANSPGHCHGRIEAQPRWAAERGYRLNQRQIPACEPVWTHGDGWVLLDDVGGVELVPDMRCYTDGWHEPHCWSNGGTPVYCDGLTPSKTDLEPQVPCCGDPLCPCATKPGWTGISTGSMDYPDQRARFTTSTDSEEA